MGENYPRALAAMKWYDVLLVNSIIDGMNLVAKEGALLNERNGVLILSEGAGASSQLGESAIVIAPTDVEGTADAIHRALTMPLEERRRRAEGLRASVEAEDVTIWFENQLTDMIRYGEVPAEEEEIIADRDLPPNIVPLTGAERVSTTRA
jgi:trehalose 6-phosphate synthase